MKAIVVGLGSMGRRRARLLKEYDTSIEITGIDFWEERRRQAEQELGIKTLESINEACRNQDFSMAFVSTSPLAHSDIITECLEHNLHIFTELNLTDKGYDKNIELAKNRNKVLFLSSTFLYRREVKEIKKEVDRCGCPLTYLYHVGQYLPDWHPWESYKNFFVGEAATNGCREFMAIEFPWLIDTFGQIRSAHSAKYGSSSLEIDFPDTYQVMLEHAAGHRGMVTIDVVSRKAVRNFELSGECLYLTWDGTPDGLVKYDYKSRESRKIVTYDCVEHREGYSSFVIENAYKSEISNFLETVAGREEPRYSFEKDRYVLSLIDKIERN